MAHLFQRSFIPSALKLFSSLPPEVVACSSLSSFLRLLDRHHLFDKHSLGLLQRFLLCFPVLICKCVINLSLSLSLSLSASLLFLSISHTLTACAEGDPLD